MTLLILLIASFPSLSQLRSAAVPVVKVILLQGSITGKKIPMPASFSPTEEGRLLLEADTNYPGKDLLDTQLIIEVIHARGPSALNVIGFTGLDEFNRSDVLKAFRPSLRSGDRIVFTFKMMSEDKPAARVINIE